MPISDTLTYNQILELMTLAFEAGFKKAESVEAGLEGKETDIEINWILNKYLNNGRNI